MNELRELSRARYAGSLRQRRCDAVEPSESDMYFLHESRDEFERAACRTNRSPGGERAPDGPLVLEERQEARRELDGRRRQLSHQVVPALAQHDALVT